MFMTCTTKIINDEQGELELCESLDPQCDGGGKKVVVGVCAMAKKSQSKPMKEILTRLDEFEYIKMLVFPEEVILKVLGTVCLTLMVKQSKPVL